MKVSRSFIENEGCKLDATEQIARLGDKFINMVVWSDKTANK